MPVPSALKRIAVPIRGHRIRLIVTIGTVAVLGLGGRGQRTLGSETPREWSISEKAAHEAEVGTIASSGDLRAGEAARYEIVSGNAEEVFAIDAQTGVLRVRNTRALDHERRPRYELRVRTRHERQADASRRRFAADLLESGVDDDAVAEFLDGAREQTVIVHVLDAPEPPVLSARPVMLVGGDAGGAAPLEGIDPDRGDSLHYELLAGDPEGWLQISPRTGHLSVRPGVELPAGASRLPVTIRVTDASGLSDAATFLVAVLAMPRPPLLAETAASEGTAHHKGELEAPAVAAPSAPDVSPEPSAIGGSSTERAVSQAAASAPVNARSDSSDEAVAESGLVSQFAPVLLMLAAAAAAVVLLRRRQRRAFARQQRQAGADTLARPLPAWLRGAPQIPRQPAVVAVPAAGPAESGVREVAGADEFEIVEEPEPAATRGGTVSRESEQWQALVEKPLVASDSAVAADASPPRFVSAVASSGSDDETAPASSVEVDADPLLDTAVHDAAFDEVIDVPAPLDDAHQETLIGLRLDSLNEADVSPELPRGTRFDDAGFDELQDQETYSLQTEATPHAEGEAQDDGSYVGGWTQDEVPFEESEVAAVHEANEALEESPSPLGLDPRVAALRAQLSNLFGVSLEQHPPLGVDESPAEVLEGPAEAEAEAAPALVLDKQPDVSEPVASGPITTSPIPAEEPVPAAESDPVRSWLEYLKNRNAPAASAPAELSALTPSPPPLVVPPPPLNMEPVPLQTSAPLIRQNKSAVRLEISHLRDIANRHTRGVLAVKASEQKARLWWFISGAGMVILCFLSMMLLKSPIALVRWCGWAFLCGAAVNLAVCVNSFQKLKVVSDSEDADSAPAKPDRADSEPSCDMLTPEMEERLEALLESDAARPMHEVHA